VEKVTGIGHTSYDDPTWQQQAGPTAFEVSMSGGRFIAGSEMQCVAAPERRFWTASRIGC
jgi:hypothetical protein